MAERNDEGEIEERKKRNRKSRRIVYPPLEGSRSFYSFFPSPSAPFFFTFCHLFPPLVEERDVLLGVFPVVVFGFVFPAKFPAYKLLPPFCLEFSLVSPPRSLCFFFLSSLRPLPPRPTPRFTVVRLS